MSYQGHSSELLQCGKVVGHNLDLCREERRRWRQEDIEQRTLENARVLWARFVEQNRRDIEERSEQLKTFSNLAALVSLQQHGTACLTAMA